MSLHENNINPSGIPGQDEAAMKAEEKTTQASKSDVLMDYEALAEAEGKEANPDNAEPHIGLIGGQSRDDERGLDVSDYEDFSRSKSSTQIIIPEAPYGTGPGNGVD